MGKATPFEGELDAFGNPMCGQSFMAGTICSRPPKHDGFCGAVCQNCGGDWMNGTCECTPTHCSVCNDDLMIEGEVEEGMCAECMLAATDRYCACCLADPEVKAHEDDCDLRPPTAEELADTYRSLGVIP